ncbi:chitotriosidase-1 [Biomphalaria glabrata]|nr:chitotriosidase-1 [Biomphalaria glabrata]
MTWCDSSVLNTVRTVKSRKSSGRDAIVERHGTLFHFSNNVRYQQLCQDYLSSAKKFRLFDSTPYAAGRAVISHRTRDYILHYDDVVSVKKKVDYINEKGLAGIVVWEFIYDDSMGICFDVRVPLLKAANEKCR